VFSSTFKLSICFFTSYWTTLKIHYKLRFKRPFQALLLKISGKCQNNASFYPVFHSGAAEGMWLARGAMDLKRLKTPGLEDNIVTSVNDCRRDFRLDDWICYTLYIHTVRDWKQYKTIGILDTFQFTVAQALVFSVFTSRIPATDLTQSHCNLKSDMKYLSHSLVSFLAFHLNHFRLPSPELDPVLIPVALDLRNIVSWRTSRKTPSSVVKGHV
jgi:hypothetical protein